MGLLNYGVLIGAFNRIEQEPKDDYGRWFHGFIYINTNNQVFKCAVDVNKPDGGFQYMFMNLKPNLFTKVSEMSDGYYELQRNSSSGAIDYVRSPIVNQSKGCMITFYNLISRIFNNTELGLPSAQNWIVNTGEDALIALNNLVSNSSRLYIFGAPFHDTNPTRVGMHDVHMNQGDPPGQFQQLDGIWQDGCVIAEKDGDSIGGYFGKFITQTLNTNENGLPA